MPHRMMSRRVHEILHLTFSMIASYHFILYSLAYPAFIQFYAGYSFYIFMLLMVLVNIIIVVFQLAFVAKKKLEKKKLKKNYVARIKQRNVLKIIQFNEMLVRLENQ